MLRSQLTEALERSAEHLERRDLREYARHDPYEGYRRSLTPRGGLQFEFCDQAGNGLLDALRCLAWLIATSTAAWLVWRSPLSGGAAVGTFSAASLLISFLVRWKFKRWHSIEIHPDGMIVDGRMFELSAIGDQWPQLQAKGGDNVDRLVFAGRYGAQYIEFCTCNRLGSFSDRTPELLADDLEMAMEQLWGRPGAFS